MKRRDFITVLPGATAWMSAAPAQEPRRAIGVLDSASYGAFPGTAPAFIQGLKATGFLEGKNISIEWRWAEGQYNRLPSQAAELVGRNVAVIVAFSVPSAFAAKAATKTIPIVFLSGADPVKVGLVESFSRPNGNLTGMTGYVSVTGPKCVEVLHELPPDLNTIALLGNPANANFQADVPDTRTAVAALKQPEVMTASTEGELEAAFVTMVQLRVGGLVVMPDPTPRGRWSI
jgi:putative tryptophan/tyrosine transport system substrate-binding protein